MNISTIAGNRGTGSVFSFAAVAAKLQETCRNAAKLQETCRNAANDPPSPSFVFANSVLTG